MRQLLLHCGAFEESYQVAHDDLRLSISRGWTAGSCALYRCSLSPSCVLADTSYRCRYGCLAYATTSASTTTCELATGAEDFIKALV